jgi:ABC-type Fe3+-siderophore transport system permease subunit
MGGKGKSAFRAELDGNTLVEESTVMWSLPAVFARDLPVLSLLAAASSPMTPEQEAAHRIVMLAAVLFGAFLGGAIVGLLPLIVALRRGRRTFAFASWASCILANFLLGILLSVPLAVVLTVIVVCLEKQGEKNLVYTVQAEPARNIYEGVPLGVSQVEPPDCAGSPLRPR